MTDDQHLLRWQELRSGMPGMSRGLIVELRPPLNLSDHAWFPSNFKVWEPTADEPSPESFDAVILNGLRWQNLVDDGSADSKQPAKAQSLLRAASYAVRKGKPILAHTTQRFAELKRPAESTISPFNLDASRLLALEELAYLLQSHCELPAPQIDKDSTSMYLTPIERRLAQALRTAKIPFQVQVPLDRFVVDFLIDNHLVVECDGESWHDPATDEKRDARLRELNFKVIRFTGRAIVRDPSHCVSRIRDERKLNHVPVLNARIEMTSAQRNAATHIDGPAIVVAPAGSGKTRVIEERVRRLIASGVEPGRICVVSFTNAAVNEVSERLQEHPEVVTQTLNKFANEVVKSTRGILTVIEGHRNPRIPTPLKIVQSVSQVVGYSPPHPQNQWWLELRDAISNYRSSFMLPDYSQLGLMLSQQDKETESEYESRCKKLFHQIHNAYENALRQQNLTDFNGQIVEAIRILTQNYQVRLEISQRFDYWLIDEFQDLSPPKILLARLLVSPARNLMVVGDDDQIIYGFAGAHPQSFSTLDRDWSDVTSLPLDKNFRSPHELVVRTRWMIERNKKRIPKATTPVRPIDDEGCVITRPEATMPDQFDYATAAVNEFEQLSKTRPVTDFIFLFRTRYAAAPVEFILEERNIPFVPLAKQSLLVNATAKWIFSWLRVINFGGASSEDWSQVLRRPVRYLTNDTVKWIASAPDPYSRIVESLESNCEHVPGLSIKQKEKPEQVRDALGALKRTIDAARRFPDSLGDQMRQLELRDALSSEAAKKQSEGSVTKQQRDGRTADPMTIYDIVALLAELSGTWSVLSDFLERAGSDKDIDLDIPNQKAGPQAALELLTIHRFKGREKPIVFVLGPQSGCMPDSRAVEENEIEEERRIAYVAATRAKERLYFWCSYLYEDELMKRADGLTWEMYRQGIETPQIARPENPITQDPKVVKPQAVTERQPGLLESALKWIASWFK